MSALHVLASRDRDDWHRAATTLRTSLMFAESMASASCSEADPPADPDPLCTKILHLALQQKPAGAVAQRDGGERRRSTTTLGAGEAVSLQEREWEEVRTRRLSARVVAAPVNRAISADADITKMMSSWSTEPTSTLVLFEPKLESGVVKDTRVLKDYVRDTPVLGFLVDKVLGPLCAVFILILGLLLPAWGPFALSAMVSTDASNATGSILLVGVEGTEGWAEVSLGLMGVYAVAGTVMCLIVLMDSHPGTVLLLLREAKFNLTLNIGSRLVYTVAAATYFPNPNNVLFLIMCQAAIVQFSFQDARSVTQLMRRSREANSKTHGNIFVNIMLAFTFIFEMARHFAVLHALSDDAANAMEAELGRGLGVSNLNVMNVSFSTSMILTVRYCWVLWSSRGTRFIMIRSHVNLHAEYDDDDVMAAEADVGEAEVVLGAVTRASGSDF